MTHYLNGQYDYFFSYSRDIYVDIAEKLISAIECYGIKLWVDKTDVILGENLDNSIDNTLASVNKWKGAIVLIDDSFLRKDWCKMELNYFISNKISILPILYKIDKSDIPHEFITLTKLNLARICTFNDIHSVINRVLNSFLINLPLTQSQIEINSATLSCLLKDYYETEETNPIISIKADSIVLCIKCLLDLRGYTTKREDIILFNLIHKKTLDLFQHEVCSRHDIKLIKQSLNMIIQKFNVTP